MRLELKRVLNVYYFELKYLKWNQDGDGHNFSIPADYSDINALVFDTLHNLDM